MDAVAFLSTPTPRRERCCRATIVILFATLCAFAALGAGAFTSDSSSGLNHRDTAANRAVLSIGRFALKNSVRFRPATPASAPVAALPQQIQQLPAAAGVGASHSAASAVAPPQRAASPIALAPPPWTRMPTTVVSGAAAVSTNVWRHPRTGLNESALLAVAMAYVAKHPEVAIISLATNWGLQGFSEFAAGSLLTTPKAGSWTVYKRPGLKVRTAAPTPTPPPTAPRPVPKALQRPVLGPGSVADMRPVLEPNTSSFSRTTEFSGFVVEAPRAGTVPTAAAHAWIKKRLMSAPHPHPAQPPQPWPAPQVPHTFTGPCGTELAALKWAPFPKPRFRGNGPKIVMVSSSRMGPPSAHGRAFEPWINMRKCYAAAHGYEYFHCYSDYLEHDPHYQCYAGTVMNRVSWKAHCILQASYRFPDAEYIFWTDNDVYPSPEHFSTPLSLFADMMPNTDAKGRPYFQLMSGDTDWNSANMMWRNVPVFRTWILEWLDKSTENRFMGDDQHCLISMMIGRIQKHQGLVGKTEEEECGGSTKEIAKFIIWLRAHGHSGILERRIWGNDHSQEAYCKEVIKSPNRSITMAACVKATHWYPGCMMNARSRVLKGIVNGAYDTSRTAPFYFLPALRGATIPSNKPPACFSVPLMNLDSYGQLGNAVFIHASGSGLQGRARIDSYRSPKKAQKAWHAVQTLVKELVGKGVCGANPTAALGPPRCECTADHTASGGCVKTFM